MEEKVKGEEIFTLEVSEYDAVRLEKFKENYSLISCRIVGGKYYPIWAKYKTGFTSYREIPWPVKVSLGKKEQAILFCKAVLEELEEKSEKG